MTPTVALALYAAPAALIAVALAAHASPGPRPRTLLALARVVTLSVLVAAVAAAGLVFSLGPVTSALLGYHGIGLSLRLDALSTALFVLVSFVGAVVVQFSRNYLDGDGRQAAFVGGLCLALAAVTLLALAGNLLQLVAGWIATSLALHRLLVFYPERPRAINAARKKYLTARLGDACLVIAAVLLYGSFRTADIAAILHAAATTEAASTATGVAAGLIAVAALLKSAQFPAHGWLPEVMETPTPVSALLHAGIINAGGFLVIRFADVMTLAPGSLHFLALVGGFTALFGAAVMLTQTSIKVSLAWSTVSQMGFMMLQCGLGLFSLAVLHLVAHSLYKAHAFLSSGSVVDIARASWVPDKSAPRATAIALSVGLAVLLYAGVGLLFGLTMDTPPQVLTLGAILVMGLTLLMAQAAAGGTTTYVLFRTLATGAGVTVAYFALHAAAEALYAGLLPTPATPTATDLLVMILAVGSFGAVTVLQVVEPSRADSPFWRAARVHIANGLYVNAAFDRLIQRPAAKLK